MMKMEDRKDLSSAMQSRTMCVKCLPDGELPEGRKGVSPAVHGSHPAATADSRFISCCGFIFCEGGIFMRNLLSPITKSRQELKKVSTITACAMFGALSVVLSYYSIRVTPNLKVGLGALPKELVDYLFGPFVGPLFGGAMDIIKYMLQPDGGFMPGFTFNAMLAAFIYGMFLYQKPLSLKRMLIAKLIVVVLCNIILGTWWLSMINGRAWIALLPARAIKNLIQWPVDSILFFLVARALEQAGAFRILGKGKHK